MEEKEFEELAGRVWDAMPEHFKKQVENVALLIEDEPSPELRKEEKLTEHETLLGLYHGIPAIERGSGYGVGGTLPDTVTLFRLPILEEAHHLMHARHLPQAAAIEEAVRETIWHEVGHYFGLGDESLHHREDEGTNQFSQEGN